MWTDLNRMEENCPEALKIDIDEIITLSRRCLFYIKIVSNQDLSEVKVFTQRGFNYLSRILSKYITILINNHKKEESITEMGIEFKFQEDIGKIINDIEGQYKDRKSEGLIGITFFLGVTGKLQRIFDFLIFYPIIEANKKYENLNNWTEKVFEMIKTNAGILGYSITIPKINTSKLIVPTSTAMISHIEDEKPESKEGKIGDKKELRELVEEQEEEIENSEEIEE